jgi:hypothetical protein
MEQENWVKSKIGISIAVDPRIEPLYNSIKQTTDYSTIIAFLYGDKAAESLGFKVLGHSKDPL